MFGRKRVISKLALTPPAPHPDRKGIAICLIVRNEARHIGEWAAFHLAAGVDHFIVYDNGCDDGTIAALQAVLPKKNCTILPWDQKLEDARTGTEIHNQILAYAHCLRNFGGRFRWMAFIDVDEFLIPVQADTLPEALAPLDDAAHISLPWHMFGRGGHKTAPEGGVLTNYLDRQADPFASPRAQNWKCIVDPTKVTAARVHQFDISGHSVGINDVGNRAAHAARGRKSFYSNAAIQLNHYYTRSDAELAAKISRGSNKTVEVAKHRHRVMRIVEAIERETVEDRTALDYLARRGLPASM